jgi:putative DNA primase/helicase
MVINGVGKQRAERTGYARRVQRWTTNLLSTGENTVDHIMSETGKQTHAGQSVRLLNVPCSFKYGVFNNLHEFKGGVNWQII